MRLPLPSAAARTVRPRSRIFGGAAAAALAAAALVSACGGSDDAQPVSIVAGDDRATATWNQPLTMDVTANDLVTRGALRVTGILLPPTQGTAEIVDGRIVYTPRPGFYGPDTMRYTVQADENGATASAGVDVTVQAVLSLSGVAVDAPLAGAKVQVRGADSVVATADAQGRWQLRARVSDPQEVVRIVATGVGAQKHVQLVSDAVGAELVQAATGAEGAVDERGAAALAVTHFTTAATALAERAAGFPPMTAPALRTAQAKVAATDVLSLATLIHQVADEGLALPEGRADTWALARDAAASSALLARQTADAASVQAFTASQSRALAGVPAAGGLPASGRYWTYATYSASGGGYAVTLSAGGRAEVSDFRGTRGASWVQEGGAHVLTLDAPFSSTQFSTNADPVTGRQAQLRMDTTALRIKPLSGGLAEVAQTMTQTYLTESRAGQVETLSRLADPGIAQALATQAAGASLLGVQDVSVGRRWAGVLAAPLEGFNFAHDTFEITGPGTGRLLRQGTALRMEVGGDALTLVGADGTRWDYVPLAPAGADGAVPCMVVERRAGQVRATTVRLIPPGAAFVWQPDTAARVWSWDAPPGSTGPVVLRPDGTSQYFTEAATWRIAEDGRLRILRPRSATSHIRVDWIPVARGTDGSVWVLRALVSENPAVPPQADTAPGLQWSLLRYRDLGPAPAN